MYLLYNNYLMIFNTRKLKFAATKKLCTFFFILCTNLFIVRENNIYCSDKTNFFTGFFIKENYIALTFDDGPSPVNTPLVLKILKENDIKATFFVLGCQAKKYPEIIKNILENENEIGIHLWGHENFYQLQKNIPIDKLEKMLTENILKTESALIKITGKKPELLRLPYGYCKNWALQIAKNNNYKVINWTFGCDWNKLPQIEFIIKMKKNTLPGAILLMHDGGMKKRITIDSLPEIIKNAKNKGLKFITISEMLKK